MSISPSALFSQPCNFVMGGVSLEALPPQHFPEIAFAGRSNVGKSSLVNALTGQKTLAHASNTPGRTRELNFFLLAEKLMLVDLPGYGYAKAGRSEVKKWNDLVMDYLAGRPNLKRVLLLIDSRHGIKENDITTMKLLDTAAVSYQVVLTKLDKIKPEEAEQVMAESLITLKKRPAAMAKIIGTSSEKGTGIRELRAELAAFV